MDFSFSPDQQDLRRMLRDLAADHCSPERRRRAIESPEGYDEALWRLVFDELGLVGIAAPEADGGAGGSFVDAAVVLEESGGGLWPVPLLANLVAAAVAPGDGSAAVVPGAGISAAGDKLTGTASHVIDGHRAERLLVAAPEGLWSVAAGTAGVSVAGSRSLDLTRWLASVDLQDAAGEQVGDAEASARAIDMLRVALAVEAVGAARHCLEGTVAYLKTREQFGRPIGSFQALAHRAADLAVVLEAATSTAYYAAWAVAASPEEVPVVAPLAKSVCADAFSRIAAETIQMHGGIGFTWEHEAHLYFKRATSTRAILGSSHAERRLVAERAGLVGR
jgi:alkylation response protein AidB-like acyl-CoA dehydrogenase